MRGLEQGLGWAAVQGVAGLHAASAAWQTKSHPSLAAAGCGVHCRQPGLQGLNRAVSSRLCGVVTKHNVSCTAE